MFIALMNKSNLDKTPAWQSLPQAIRTLSGIEVRIMASQAGEQHVQLMAEMAVEETGMGRVADKYAKNVVQARGTPGVECLQPQVLTGDRGLTLIENAAWGVVASVTPSTNPAATVINNAISMIAAGNSVVFAPHPAAKKVSQKTVSLLNEVIVAAGGPADLLVTVVNPDIETAQRLFKYPGIGLLVVTGGDCRESISRAAPCQLAVFSPPYPNSFDYTDVYNVELWALGYIADASSNRSLRQATLSSHVQVARHFEQRPIGSAKLDAVSVRLHESRQKLWSLHLPSMVDGYFADMRNVMRALEPRLVSRGEIWAVVWDSLYANI